MEYAVPKELHGDLPASAQVAWRAYCAMLKSKETYFEYLEVLQRKYEGGGTRSLAEIARLEQLLAEHDACVKSFAVQMRELRTEDHSAHGALVSAITCINQTLGVPAAGLTH